MKRRSRDFISFLCLIFALSLGAAHGQNLDRSNHGLIPVYFRDNLIWQKEDHSQIDSSRLRYYQALDWAWNLLLNATETQRLFAALSKGKMDQVRQILRFNRIMDLRSFLVVYHTLFLSDPVPAEALWSRRIDTERLAVLLHFYRELGTVQAYNPSALVVPGASTRNDIDLVHLVIRAGRFPRVSARAHGKNLPPVEFESASWTAALEPFQRPEFDLREEYLAILAGLTNHEFGHLKFARIPELVAKFFLELRNDAREANQLEDPRAKSEKLAKARDILVIHLMNKDSENLLHTFQQSPPTKKRELNTLAAFLFQIQKMHSDQDLLRLFLEGSLPAGSSPGKTTAALQTLDLLHQGSCGDVFGDPSQ